MGGRGVEAWENTDSHVEVGKLTFQGSHDSSFSVAPASSHCILGVSSITCRMMFDQHSYIPFTLPCCMVQVVQAADTVSTGSSHVHVWDSATIPQHYLQTSLFEQQLHIHCCVLVLQLYCLLQAHNTIRCVPALWTTSMVACADRPT